MEQYLIYLRKSRSDLEAEAHGEGETLSRHEHTLLELAKRQHLLLLDDQFSIRGVQLQEFVDILQSGLRPLY